MASEVFARVGLGNSGAVPLQDTGSQRPLFLAHPGDGEVLAYAALARRLGDDQPSYGLRARGLDDDAAIDGSLAELAAEYVADVRKVQPSGPYLLGGFCVGATIAIEMAAQLRDAGEDVAGLVLLDPRFPRPVGVRYRSWRALHHSPRTDLPGAALRRFARGITSPIRHRTNGSDAGDVSSAFERIREGHELRPTAVPATVILSDEFRLFELPHWYLRRIVRRPRRWRQFPCRHAQLLLPPTVDAVAQEIRAALAASSAASRAA
jgi:thioesterase domain-containing protein